MAKKIVFTVLVAVLIALQGALTFAVADDDKFTKQELDQMLAPIALYPDDLLTNVLMASTYPLDVVAADRWRREPANAKLEGDELSGTAASGFVELPPGDDVWVVGPLTSGTDDYLNVYQQVDATVGLDEHGARRHFGGALVGRARFEDIARGQIDGAGRGLLKLISDAGGRRVVGVQIAGEGANELIHIGQLGLSAEMDVNAYVENVLGFPTMAEAYRVAALDIVH